MNILHPPQPLIFNNPIENYISLRVNKLGCKVTGFFYDDWDPTQYKVRITYKSVPWIISLGSLYLDSHQGFVDKAMEKLKKEIEQLKGNCLGIV